MTITKGNDDDVRNNLWDCAKQIRKIAELITPLITPVNDYVGITTQASLRYVASEIENARHGLRGDIKLFAWRTRNVFEAYLILRNILSNSDYAETFIAQKIEDEATILSGIRTLAPPDADYSWLLDQRVKKLKSTLAKYGFEKVKPDLISGLAGRVEMGKEYEAFYKLYSKYVHPSAWFLLSDHDEFNNETIWEAFILNSQKYAHLCRGAGLELLTKRDFDISEIS